MITEIDIYRGWKITFNTDTETFCGYSSHYDKEEASKSYAAVKKRIDDFIKDNENFRPLRVVKAPSMYNEKEAKTLIGVRKDGRFIYNNEKGEKEQLSSHYEGSYFIYDKSHDVVFAEYERMSNNIEALRKERDAYIEENFKAQSLTDWKKENI